MIKNLVLEKNVTAISIKEKNDRAKKMMLWFGIASLIMAFAGWTSAYIVSRNSRDDWSAGMQLPDMFYYSTAIIILSSFTYIWAKHEISKNRKLSCGLWLWVTLGLGVVFIVMQFQGFSQLVAQGEFFTGPSSSIKSSYVFLIAAVHIIHVVTGIISLLVVLYNNYKNKYSAKEYLGVSLGATFWHFLDLLWLYLVLFMTFVK